MKKKILIIGRGGHSLACLDILNQTKEFNLAGYVISNKDINNCKQVLGYDKDLKKLFLQYKYAFIGIGSPYQLELKKNFYFKLKKIGFKLPKIISNHALVSSTSKIGEGTIIMNGVQIGPNVMIGKNCIINSKTLIEHDCEISDHCNIATSVTINGGCKIKEKSFIGSGSIIRENTIITKNSFVKMGTIKK